MQIARALMTDPELMLLDEPAAGLDLGGREDLVARLGVLAADVEAPALVLVTHHVEEIPPSFTDVLLLREGRIVAPGPLELTLTAENLSATFGMPLRGRAARRPLGRAGGERGLLRGTRGTPAAFEAMRGRDRRCRPANEHREAGRMDWFADHAWLAWVGIALALAPSRLPPSSFVFLMLAGGALAGALAAARASRSRPGAGLAGRGRPGAACSSGPSSSASSWSEARQSIGAASPVGRSALVLPTVTENDGRVKLGGETWSAATAPMAPCSASPGRKSGLCPSRGPP